MQLLSVVNRPTFPVYFEQTPATGVAFQDAAKQSLCQRIHLNRWHPEEEKNFNAEALASDLSDLPLTL